MIPDFIPKSLVVFWIFVFIMSILPMVFAIIKVNRKEKKWIYIL